MYRIVYYNYKYHSWGMYLTDKLDYLGSVYTYPILTIEEIGQLLGGN